MKKNILILGDQGMLGHVIKAHFISLDKYNLFSTNRLEEKKTSTAYFFDANSPSTIEPILKKVAPDIVINCIALLVSDSVLNPKRAILINAYFPKLLEKYSKQQNFKFIHISTDAVFSGKKGKYIETDIPDTSEIYGLTKCLGESNETKNLNIRTVVVGPELMKKGNSLFQWFFKQKNSISGYTHVIFSCITTLEFAKQLFFLIDNDATGTVHLTAPKEISKYEFLKLLKETFKKEIFITSDSKKDLNRVLISTNKAFKYEKIDYETMFADLKKWMIVNSNKYDSEVYPFLNSTIN